MNQYIHLSQLTPASALRQIGGVPATDRVKPQESWQAAAASPVGRRYELPEIKNERIESEGTNAMEPMETRNGEGRNGTMDAEKTWNGSGRMEINGMQQMKT